MSGTPRAGDALKAIPPLLMYLGRWSWLQSLDWTVTRQKKSELIRIVNKVVLLEGAKSIAFTAATQTITQACTEIFQKIAGDFVLQLRMESNPL